MVRKFYKKEVENPRLVKARKEYECLVCQKKVEIGQKYVCFSHRSQYLKEAFEELTKFKAWVKFVEILVSLRFCSGGCYRLWYRKHFQEEYTEAGELRKRYFILIREVRDRRLKGWKDWKVWKEVFEPLDNKWRLD